MKPAQTPVELGYRMPAEWEPHAATWLSWPHERADWPGKLAPIPWVYGEVVRHLSPGERVRILVKDATIERKARAILVRVGVDLGQIDFFRVATDRSWTRDFCPLFVKSRDDGDVAIVNWKFNGWASTRTTRKTTRSTIGSRSACVASRGRRRWAPVRADGASCSRAAASTSTAAVRCSRPRSAC